MKRIACALSILLLATAALFAQKPDEVEKEAIIKVIESSYRDGLNNYGDVKAIEKGFHPGFNLLSMKKGSLTKLPIYNWIEMVEHRKANGHYPIKEKVEFKYPIVDITETAAMVKVEFYKGKAHLFTDYLSLYKFPDGWKIVSKIYHRHPKKE